MISTKQKDAHQNRSLQGKETKEISRKRIESSKRILNRYEDTHTRKLI